jgi:hypothetical protein
MPDNIDTRKIFIVVGTHHVFQKSLYDSVFVDFVLELARYHRVDFIAEEANTCSWTYAERLSAYVDAGWANVDLTPEQRSLMHLENPMAASIPGDERFFKTAQMILPPHAIREWVWAIRAAKRTKHCCLLICGIAHTLSIAFKLDNLGHTVMPHYYLAGNYREEAADIQMRVGNVWQT